MRLNKISYLFALLASTCLANEQPNFLIILADDLGYGDVSYQGGDLPTPNIDDIANKGIKMTDAYVTCPVCAPSRAGLLTGKYQQSFGFWDNIGPYRVKEETKPGTPRSIPILSERLKELGYTTGIFGKTHDGDDEELLAFNRWDEFYGFNNGASNFLGDMNRTHNPIYHNNKIVSRLYSKRGIKNDEVNQDGILVKDTENYLTDKLGDMAIKFIEKNKDKPFLCYIPFNAVHGPFQAPKEMVDKYSHVKDKKRRIVMAMLESMDNNIGRVLDCLEENQLMKKTVIIFLSDNGGHEASPNGPLRGKKGTYWEGGLRVPFAIRWDGQLPPGQTYKQAIISLDIMPTLIHLAGGEVKDDWGLDGVNLFPYLKNQSTSAPHEALYWVWSGGQRKAIREGSIKVVTMNGGRSYQMYDLAQDISESKDLSGQYPEKLSAMIKKHQKWESSLIRPQWGWNKNLGVKDPLFGKERPYHKEGYQFK
ncbi:sulfatase-like hydrolase/transferase [Lentisphaera profundi]|uniref:Sulfatase-like hydrolase/transferase n=1 Tax=Lentisphaera profundi TaxID=1658616 RepID=A0ABY7VP26_9BACT|nr:sulfatase-like hydrolase/transferase [Lentisphaera profundi]WDE95900.1 sulfatase-like hydrolase/transferase [Lentisphaera profundi]